jgi:hypothetical protein
MTLEMNQAATEEIENQLIFEIVNDVLVEELWRDLEGLITHEKIRQVAMEIAAQYQDAAVTTFLPIFVHRRTRERLRSTINND